MATSDFTRVPIVEVQDDNLKDIWPALILSVKSATFIAIDTELSGLGDRKKLNAKVLDDRYSAMLEVAQTRSIISLGISCFKLLPSHSSDDSTSATKICGLDFCVQTFNITLLCSEEYMVDPISLRFLVGHGFDFNKQYTHGIPYHRGPDKEDEKNTVGVRELFAEMVRNGKPIVLHNALVDLVFLYHNLYTTCPSSISTFVADISQMFSGGVYDTKYLAEFSYRLPASYLQYVFRQSQRQNHKDLLANRVAVRLSFLQYPDTEHILYTACGLPDSHQSQDSSQVCFQYAYHGWCAGGQKCPKSHNMDDILDNELTLQAKKAKKRQRKRKRHGAKGGGNKLEKSDLIKNASDDALSGEDDSFECADSAECTNTRHLGCTVSVNAAESVKVMSVDAADGQESVQDEQMQDIQYDEQVTAAAERNEDMLPVNRPTQENGTEDTQAKDSSKFGGHRAGYDAFMTGFILAHFIAKHGKYSKVNGMEDMSGLGFTEHANKISLTGKDIPLNVLKSHFAKTSREHKEKLMRLRTDS